MRQLFPKKKKKKKNAPEWIANKSPQSVIQLSVCRWARCVGGGGDGGGPALVSRVMSNSQRVSCFCFCFVFVFFKMLQSPPLGGAIPSAASPAEADTLEERERERQDASAAGLSGGAARQDKHELPERGAARSLAARHVTPSRSSTYLPRVVWS